MLFNSYIFIFVFLPITLVIWYVCRARKHTTIAQIALIAMSLWFYGYFHPAYLILLVGSCLMNYLLSFLLETGPLKGRVRVIRITGVLLNLLLLGYFKYCDFFLENVNFLFSTNYPLQRILLPLGISFFTFQQLSFLLDRCRGEAGHYRLVDYLSYITFFPQLIAGPIVLHDEFLPQIKDSSRYRFDAKDFSYGISWFVFGLAKKVLLADNLAQVVNFGFDTVYFLDSSAALVLAVTYMLELYLDFSGYCDMAIGIAKMFRIDLPENFNAPFRSSSVKEFWNRWHMTLGRFFTKYLYIPLGGNRKGKPRRFLNTMIVFTVSGLWHGANWTFVVWGILHGLGVSFSMLSSCWSRKFDAHKWYSVLCKVTTFFYVTLSFVIFRANSLSDARMFFKRLFAFRNFGKYPQLASHFVLTELYPITKILSAKSPQLLTLFQNGLFAFALILCLILCLRKTTRERLSGRALTGGLSWKLAILFVWSVISLSQVSTFLYFNF